MLQELLACSNAAEGVLVMMMMVIMMMCAIGLVKFIHSSCEGSEAMLMMMVIQMIITYMSFCTRQE